MNTIGISSITITYTMLHLIDIGIYNLWHWKLIQCINMRLSEHSPFVSVVLLILFYGKGAAIKQVSTVHLLYFKTISVTRSRTGWYHLPCSYTILCQGIHYACKLWNHALPWTPVTLPPPYPHQNFVPPLHYRPFHASLSHISTLSVVYGMHPLVRSASQ